MPDYKEAQAFADFWRESIWPHLQHLVDQPTSFTDYIASYYKTTASTNRTFGMPSPYIYSLEWLKRFEDRCVTFGYNHPEEIKNGAAPVSIIYQFSPTLHGLSNILTWRDEGENDGHITLFVVYEKLEEAIEFMQENMDLVKKPKAEKPVGFLPRTNLNIGSVT